MQPTRRWTQTACAVAATLALCDAEAQPTAQDATQLEAVVVTAKRANRVSRGATGMAMDVKETPQSISSIDQADMSDFSLTGSNDALNFATGINVEQYETNRATFNSRGFEIQLTQLDGLGMTNSYGTVVGQEDTFLFERIELIRGANGLLTGVGNASGTINYIRKRPKNQDGGEAQLTFGSHSQKRAAVDINKVLTEDGSWAARFVAASEDKKSYLRDLHNRRTSLYGVVDGQVGTDGVLTAGLTVVDAKQHAPMWGSLTLLRSNGTQADFDVNSSTSQNWTYWDNRSYNAFVEYTHRLANDWEAKVTYNYRHGDESTKLLYAYSPTGVLNPDDTGLVGYPYRSDGSTNHHVVDANVGGEFAAFGRLHRVLLGVSQSTERTAVDTYAPTPGPGVALPAFPYGGDVYAEPSWGPRSPASRGEQTLTRLYAASHLGLTDALKGVVGVNAVRLERTGASIYGSVATNTDYPDTHKVSPYLGLTYAFTPATVGYVSYSDIFQNQDQTDIKGEYLPPVKGVNTEAGVKSEWLDRSLLTTFALFTARETGLATYSGIISGTGTSLDGQYFYEGKDVKSKGYEVEATGRLTNDAKVTVGYTRLILKGPDGNDIYEWVPRQTLKFRVDGRLPVLPALRAGVAGRWQSAVQKIGSASQGAYMVADAFVSYGLTTAATLRLNVNNVFDKKYVGGLAYGAIYGAPRGVSLTLDYKL